MTNVWRSRGQIALLGLSLIGIGISIYLTAVHYQGATLVCSTSGLVNCERVLSSSYSVVPGTKIPISIPGLLWFVVTAILAAFAWLKGAEHRSSRIAELVWTSLGMLTVFYLVYAEIVQLHAICIWCTTLHIIIFIMFLGSILLSQGQDAQDGFEEEDEETSPATITSNN